MQQEKKYPILPANDAVQNWFEENIDKECSASSAIYKFRMWLESLQCKEPGAIWLEADTKPEHNVGVLVFIPGEDNHITSGMWDIDNKWVLLDEYRTPEEEVTHWMPLPAFPEGYSHDVISDEWVSTLKAIAKEELAKRPSKEGNKVSMDWIDVNDRLPELETKVIVLRPNEYSKKNDVLMAYLHDSGEVGRSHGQLGESKWLYGHYWSLPAIVEFKTITHWLPLPVTPQYNQQKEGMK